jgi:hypothetical protein
MRALLAALTCVSLLPATSLAQTNEDEASEGTYSTYSSEEARPSAPDYPAEPEVAQPTVSYEQQLFDTFYNELARYGRWDDDPTYGWVWYPFDEDFRPYTDGWWVYTNEGWSFESEAQYAWAVYHYGRWVPMPSGWAWIPGFVWAPAWVSMRSSDGYIGWSPLGPNGLVYEYMPYGWRWSWSPWVFLPTEHFGNHHSHRHYVEFARARSVFHEARPVGAVVRGGEYRYHEIPYVHNSAPITVSVSNRPPVRAGESSGVTIYRPTHSARPVNEGYRPQVGSPVHGSQPINSTPSYPSQPVHAQPTGSVPSYGSPIHGAQPTNPTYPSQPGYAAPVHAHPTGASPSYPAQPEPVHAQPVYHPTVPGTINRPTAEEPTTLQPTHGGPVYHPTTPTVAHPMTPQPTTAHPVVPNNPQPPPANNNNKGHDGDHDHSKPSKSR